MNRSANDTILLNMSEAEFGKMVSELLKLAREGDLLALSTLPLGHATIVADSFFAGEAVSSDARGRAVHSILRWAVDRLRPTGEHSWLATSWRGYNILHCFYIEGMKASDLAEAMAISEQTLYQSRPQAVANVATILREEILSPTDRRNRERYAMTDRYASHSAMSQRILRTTAVFTRSLPISLIHQMIEDSDIDELQSNVHTLVGSSLLVVNQAGTEVALRPEMRDFLLTMLSPDERSRLHQAASLHYLQQHDYLEAARQLRQSGDMAGAASVLIKYKKMMFDNLQIEELAELVGEFQRPELTLDLWTKLKIVSGEIAEFSKETEVALTEYQQALAAPDKMTKALAYYRRARAFERQSVGESLAHYGYAIRLIEERADQSGDSDPDRAGDQLLLQMYIDRAWIFIQVQPDMAKAKADLARAQQLISEQNRTAWSDLHNAFGRLYVNQHRPDEAAHHYWEAWLAANEIQDIARMTNTAHNLGDTLSDQGDFEQAIHYLGQSLELSVKSNNRQMQGLCNLSIGACHFYQNQFDDAIYAYKKALGIFEETNNHTIQLRAYFNLAEVYAALNDVSPMRRYFDEGYSRAQQLKDEAAVRDFLRLCENYPILNQSNSFENLNPRQELVLKHLQNNEQITNREYQIIASVSQKQAVRDLNELIKLGLINRQGKGRATHYRLVSR